MNCAWGSARLDRPGSCGAGIAVAPGTLRPSVALPRQACSAQTGAWAARGDGRGRRSSGGPRCGAAFGAERHAPDTRRRSLQAFVERAPAPGTFMGTPPCETRTPGIRPGARWQRLERDLPAGGTGSEETQARCVPSDQCPEPRILAGGVAPAVESGVAGRSIRNRPGHR
jgi:hypothetical protein